MLGVAHKFSGIIIARAGRCTRARGASFAAFAATLAVRASLALGLRRRLGAARGCTLCAGGNAHMLGAAHCAFGDRHCAWGARHYAFMSPI